MSNFRRSAAALAPGAVLLALLSSPAHGAASTYVALGDSYSSGVGTRTYLADGTSCQRSVYAFPSLLASSGGYQLNLRACSGATVADVTAQQLGDVTSGTAAVSVSVGGNDAGFASVLTECAKPAWASNCNGAIDRVQAVIDGPLPARLDTLYASIRTRAPHARAVAVGYPRIFNGQDCNLFTWFSPTEESRLNATADRLNAKISAAASARGLAYANPTSAFRWHAVCDNPEWLNGLSNAATESFHPNRTGHSSGYAPLVGPALGVLPTALAPLSREQVQSSARRLTLQQRRYAVQDRRIRPKEFHAPDLDSPQIRRAAARAGVDLTSRASIDRADRTYAARQTRAFRSRG